MSRYWSEVVRGLRPYVPGEQPKLGEFVKLNTNENPCGPSPRAIEAMRGELDDSLRLYPDPNADELRQAIAASFSTADVSARQVFVGNGSDEVLAHVFQALLKHQLPVLFPDVTYSFYPVYCGLYAIDYVAVPLDADFAISTDDYLVPNGGIIFPNPNAPTGCFLPLADVERIVAANAESPVVIDEAYVDFGGESAVALVARYPNLLVVRTLSKSHSLAGLRVGYAIGQTDLIEALERVKNSFNSYPLGRLAIAGATAAIRDRAHFERTRRAVIASRENLAQELAALGFQVLPSKANFLFVRHPAHEAQALASALRQRGIIVRHFQMERISQYLRISIGTDAQCRQLVAALTQILA